MATAGERLRQLAGFSGSAAALLLALGTGATAGELLVSRSGLDAGTAAEHLLADSASAVLPIPGGVGGSNRAAPRPAPIEHEPSLSDRIREDDEEVILIVTQLLRLVI